MKRRLLWGGGPGRLPPGEEKAAYEDLGSKKVEIKRYQTGELGQVRLKIQGHTKGACFSDGWFVGQGAPQHWQVGSAMSGRPPCLPHSMPVSTWGKLVLLA